MRINVILKSNAWKRKFFSLTEGSKIMKYSHDYSKLKLDEYTTIRRYPKGKVGSLQHEYYPAGQHWARIIEIDRKTLVQTPLGLLQKDTDLETRTEIYRLFQSFYRKKITPFNDKWYIYRMTRVNKYINNY